MKLKICLVSLLTFAAIITCSQAREAYFKADGITGDSPREKFSGYSTVFGYNHEVASARGSNGLPTGRRQHAPFKILKAVGGNSPEFMNKLVSNQVIPNAELQLLFTDPNGESITHYTYSFTGVQILSIRNWLPNTIATAPNSHDPQEFEEITFTYQTITWKSLTANTEATDSTVVDASK